ncbi:MAG: carbohydrate porin [Burkholderiaceae bacterium]|nr:carbohydrate porin [Burkholderiaceae bacterium]
MQPFTLRPVAFLVSLLALSAASAPAWSAEDEGEETSMARFQSTYIFQKKPSFAAQYSGPNSVGVASERSYTFTLSAYLGFKPWQDGEIYLVPELTQGIPLSGLVGLGGFTNGEATRVGGSNPKLYRQKLFLRQTWNQGGERQRVEGEVDQMAGWVERNRLVLTAGNFSALDIFDDNAYAKDPRTQFMNWSSMAHASYDYAADARGFGWGAALEWYTGDWVLRAGRLTGPKSPNALPLDFRIGKHYGDQVELEHAHTLAGEPGKVRLLAWRNRAVLASYSDALRYGLAHPADPDTQWIGQVRSGIKTKYGVGLNLEQALSDRAGVFLRAMKADGRTETYAFTEADASLSFGGALKGNAWGRAADTLGVSFMRNGLSKDRREYLKAGGISFFIGDGGLHYRPETIYETYYSWNASKHLWVTFDVQRILNPAYNAARGPISVGSVRLHAEF